MPVSGIKNQTANIGFGLYKNPDAQSKKYSTAENVLLGGGLLTLVSGIAIDVFDKKGKINKKIPKALDIISLGMFISACLIGLKSEKSK